MMHSASLCLILSVDNIHIDNMDTRTGRIYKIVCSKSNDVYVGSTFNALRTRMSQHKRDFEKGCMLGGYPQFMEHGWESLKMILIAEYQVIDRKHLLMYEQLWMNKHKSCNKNYSFQIITQSRLTDRPSDIKKKVERMQHRTPFQMLNHMRSTDCLIKNNQSKMPLRHMYV